jgi:hypothetical protein
MGAASAIALAGAQCWPLEEPSSERITLALECLVLGAATDRCAGAASLLLLPLETGLCTQQIALEADAIIRLLRSYVTRESAPAPHGHAWLTHQEGGTGKRNRTGQDSGAYLIRLARRLLTEKLQKSQNRRCSCRERVAWGGEGEMAGK